MESIPPSKQTKGSTFIDPLKGLITSSSGDERRAGKSNKHILKPEEEKKLPELHECLEESESIFNLAPSHVIEEQPTVI
jgi:hypothetical protein